MHGFRWLIVNWKIYNINNNYDNNDNREEEEEEDPRCAHLTVKIQGCHLPVFLLIKKGVFSPS